MSELDDLAGLMTCNLPGEMMMEILSRLSIKTLFKFTSVCKAWRALIKNQAFINLHFQQSANSLDNDHYLITRGNKLTNLTDTFFVSYDYELEKVNLSVGLFHPAGLVGVVGSCHGLICTTPNDFVMCGNSYIIYNPAIHEFKEIFKYRKHEVITRKSHFISSGFGYDSRLYDYKIVRLEQYEVNSEILSFCDVYSKGSDSWRRIDAADVNGTLVERLSKANVNGYLHWLAKRNDRAYILSFNISEEVFGEIMLPKRGPEKYFHLHVWKQRLALIYYLMEPRENKHIEIWWMKVYGLRRSWAKESVIGPNPGFYLMLASRDNGQFMFINENTEKVFVYDHITNEAKNIALPAVMPGNSNKEVQVVNYKESLIPVNEHSKFELKGYPWVTTSLTWKRHLPMLFLMCWWFCSWMGLKKLSWETIMSRIDMRGATEHVWGLVCFPAFFCLVVYMLH